MAYPQFLAGDKYSYRMHKKRAKSPSPVGQLVPTDVLPVRVQENAWFCFVAAKPKNIKTRNRTRFPRQAPTEGSGSRLV